ncbi:MAG: phosphoribosylanthranilate isomerase, partial [Bacteroidota bacterium]
MTFTLNRPKIKICCISSLEEAFLAIKHGTDALGLVGNMPSGPGIISDELISQITKHIPPPIATFLITSEMKASDIIANHQKVHTNTIQIVDYLLEMDYAKIREAIPTVKIVQVIHVLDEKQIEEALEVEPWVDAILLDSGNPNLKVKILGGTGNSHDWKLSRKIREAVKKPVFLAGGINAQNVQQAIEEVNPYGIDLC